MDIKKLPVGKNPPEEVNVFIEIPQGVSVKYELDKESGTVFVDRFLYTEMEYPFNYGFVPKTLSGDGDPIDVLVLSSKPVAVGVVIPSKPIGVLEMEDEAGEDTKVIAVPLAKVDPKFASYNDVSDIPEEIKEKIKYFFENYKKTEPGKWVKVREWKGKEVALEEIRKAIK
ncbi:MAG: inorganic diphosphatase [Candidatus Giovannonibacteria bacterium]|nr:inorganic diphosphatase [Candidatus Giovannonibacteria bacterium]